MPSIRQRLASLRKAYPRMDPGTRFLYRVPSDLRRSYSHVVAYVVLRSDERTYALHPIKFLERDPKNPGDWDDWFDEHLDEILHDKILPSLFSNKGKLWRVVQFIGFSEAT